MAEQGWVRIDMRSWRYEDGHVRFFLLAGDEEALLVDSGDACRTAREQAEELLASEGLDLPLSLINTHADDDHVASNHEFECFYMSPAELVNLKMPHTPDQVIPVFDGDIIDLGGRELEVVGIPGHTPGSIGILDDAAGLLFSGDPIQDGEIYMFGPMRDMCGYVLSLEMLDPVLEDVTAIYPSHGSCPVSCDLVPQLAQAARQIMAGELPFRREERHGHKIRVYDVGVATFLCDDE